MKIIATMGPSSMKSQVLKQLITSGLESIRLNFSHFHDEEFHKIVSEVRNINNKVEIIGDLRGRKVRVSEKVFSTYKIHMEDIVYFCGEDMYDYLLKDERLLKSLIPLNINSSNINKNKINKISMKDDTMNFEVLDQSKGIIKSRVLNEGIIRGGKGCNIPELTIDGHGLSILDKESIIWGLNHDLDSFCQSYVESEKDIIELKEFVEKNNKRNKEILYYGKIETEKGINSIEKICDSVDEIIIARGDLMPECGIEDAVKNQYIAINKLKEKGYEDKIIMATHLLDSMIKGNRAKYTEVESIFSFMVNGINGFLLAGETSIGKYPVEAFLFLKSLIEYYA